MLVSPKLPDLIPAIEGLPLPTRKVLMSFMQEIENLNDDASGENADAHDYHDDAAARKQSRASSLVAPETKGDHLLELEEQYAHLMAQLKRRENEYADLEERFAQTQKTNGELKAQSTRKDEELKDQRSLNSERAQSSLRDLEFKISEQEEIITSKELELAQSQSRVVSLQREHEKFSESKKSFQKLDDDLKIMRVELEKQTKKANTADHYLRKLQLNQSIENERDKMRLELEDARKSLKMTDDLRQENAALQVSNNEKSQTISQIERDLLEHQRTKKQLRINYDSLTQEVHGLNERFAQDQETIADLKDRHGSSESHSSPTIVNGGLESELADTSKYENQMQVSNILVRWLRILTYNRKIRITELEKQNQALSSDAFSSNTQLAVLQKQLESAQEATADHIGHTSDMRQELLALETSFGQIRQGHPIEGFVTPWDIVEDPAHLCPSTEIFQRMRDQLKAKQHRCHDLEVQLSKVCNSLGNAQNDRMSSAENYMMISALGIDLLTGSIMDKSNHETVQEDRYQTSLTDVDPQAERRLSGDDARMDSNDVDIDNMSVDRLTQIIQRASSEDAESQKSWAELFVSNIERGRERLAKQQKVERQISMSKSAFHKILLSEKAAPIPLSRSRSLLKRISKKIWTHANE